MTATTAPGLATRDDAGDDDVAQAPATPPRPDICTLLAQMFLDLGYGPEEVGPFVESFGASTSWKQQVRTAMAVLQSAAAY
jgi:hypothetical protein